MIYRIVSFLSASSILVFNPKSFVFKNMYYNLTTITDIFLKEEDNNES